MITTGDANQKESLLGSTRKTMGNMCMQSRALTSMAFCVVHKVHLQYLPVIVFLPESNSFANYAC